MISSLFVLHVCKVAERREKTIFYVFCFYTPLYRCFRPSRVSQTIDLEEIYRLVSKILHFMACGSVLGSFTVLARYILETLLKIYRNSIEISSKFYWDSIEILWTFCWTFTRNTKTAHTEPHAMKLRIFDTNR